MQTDRIFLKDYTPPDFEVESLHLFFNLDETRTKVLSQAQYIKKCRTTKNMILDGIDLKILSLKINDADLNTDQYTVGSETLTLFNVPDNFTFSVEVEINPQKNLSCEGLYLSKNIFCTQCEAASFKKITYFLDRPDVLTKYTVDITANKKKYPLLLSNGNLVDKKDLSANLHWARWVDPYPKPCYLFALVAGDLGVITDKFITRSGRSVKLEIFAPHGKQSRCHHAMSSLKKAMAWDEEKFSLEYDLDQYMIVSIDDFNMGAMENKGLNIFNSKLILADEKTATDTDFDQIESVIAHEYFHNWTGNRVTCRNWFELSLKEGLTVFRDQEFSSDMNSASVQRINDVDSLRSRQFAEDAGPSSHPVRPASCLSYNNFYTSTVYEKGAEVIRMLQTLVGREGFKRGMSKYFELHDGQAVTIDDFLNCMSLTNTIDLTQFKNWYSQAGTPLVTISDHYDSETQVYKIILSQKVLNNNEPLLEPFLIPLEYGLIDAKGTQIKSGQIVFKNKQQTFEFNKIYEKPTLSINRNFSAPIKIKYDQSFNDLHNLLKFDTDYFNKRESAQNLMLAELKILINSFKNQLRPLHALQKDNEIKTRPDVIEALTQIVQDNTLDKKFKSLILNLPPDNIILQEVTILDAKCFYLARNLFKKDFAKNNKDLLLQIYFQNHKLNTSDSRDLKNRALDYLFALNNPEIDQLIIAQYNESENMTDKIFALQLLSHLNTSASADSMSNFYSKWRHDAVVFNLWLKVVAQSKSVDAFKKIQSAYASDEFDKKNPNNIRSLLANFETNFLIFHSEDHNTYEWYSEKLIECDKINPQAAARLCAAFNVTNKLPENLKVRSLKCINFILEQKDLSKNSREILEKIG